MDIIPTFAILIVSLLMISTVPVMPGLNYKRDLIISNLIMVVGVALAFYINI